MPNFQSFVYSSPYKVIGVVETWLTPSIFDNEILPSQYFIFRKDRPTRGGGVLLAVHKLISARLASSPLNLEVITVECYLNFPVTFCIVYSPPNASEDYHQHLLEYLHELALSSTRLIIIGDFNLPDISWERLSAPSSISSQFCNLLFDLNLHQLITDATHIKGNTLDLLITNSPDMVSNLTLSRDTISLFNSDHFLVSFDLLAYCKTATHQPSKVFNYSKADMEGLCNYLLDLDFSPCLASTDPEFVWSYIKQAVFSGVNLFVPVVRQRAKSYPRWFSSDIIHDCNRLRTFRRAKSSKFARLKESLDRRISLAKLNYESSLINNLTSLNCAKVFNHIRYITQSSDIPSSMYLDNSSACSDKDIAILFNKYFHSVFASSSSPLPPLSDLPPMCNTLTSISIEDLDVFQALVSLNPSKAMGCDDISPRILRSCALGLYVPLHHLFCLSLSSSVLPAEWSVHVISPIHKSGDRSSVRNYRPISLLCSVSKVLERIIYDKIIDFVSSSLSPYQFGFLARRSVVQQLLVSLNKILSSFSCHSQTDVLYLDIRKAFDSIPHNELLLKLWHCGICGKLWLWFKSYLYSRTQCVSVRGQKSDFLPVLSGVPQGSILGPLLFLIYINDLPSTLSSSFPLMFADDTKLLKPIHHNSDCLLLQGDIDHLSLWSKRSNLEFNHLKCVLMRFCPKSPHFNQNYTINNSPILCTSIHRDLGVLMSSDLNWSPHMDHICSKAYKLLGLLRRTFSSSCSPHAKKTLYLCLVRSQLTFCSQIWRPHLHKDIKSLERVQRRATKFILGDYEMNYKNRLLSLNLFPLMYFLEMNDLFFFLRSIKDPPPNFNILDYVSFCQNSTRSSSFNKLNLVHSSNGVHKFFYFNRLPRLWNSLPPIDLSQSLSSIKSKIRSHLWSHFIKHFDPLNPCSFHFSCPCSKCSSLPCTSLLS